MQEYLHLLDDKAKKPEKISFVESTKYVNWNQITANKDGTYGKANVNKYIFTVQSRVTFPEESYENKIVQANRLLIEQADLKKALKTASDALHLKTKDTIENLSDSQVNALLKGKWINPILDGLNALPTTLINDLSQQVQTLADKYATTYADVARDIKATEQSLATMLDELTGNETDEQGLAEFKKLLLGDD